MQKFKCKICGQDFESGKDSLPNDSVCPGCVKEKTSIQSFHTPKNRNAYAFLAFFLGWCGVHNFYSGHIANGIIKLILFLVLLTPVFWEKASRTGILCILLTWIIIELFTQTRDAQKLKMKDSGTLATACGIFLSLFLLGIVLPAIGAVREPARRIACSSNLKQIGIASLLYSKDNSDFFPNTDNAEALEILRSNSYLSDYKIYVCPITNKYASDSGSLDEKNTDYIYFGGLKTSDAPETILALDKHLNHRSYVNVLYVNGSVYGSCYPSGVTSYEGILSYLYRGNFTDPVRLKQLEKAKEFDRKFNLTAVVK